MENQLKYMQNTMIENTYTLSQVMFQNLTTTLLKYDTILCLSLSAIYLCYDYYFLMKQGLNTL